MQCEVLQRLPHALQLAIPLHASAAAALMRDKGAGSGRWQPTCCWTPAACCRWEDLENNKALQEYTNYGLALAYGSIATIALVRTLGRGCHGGATCLHGFTQQSPWCLPVV